jgi:T5SS/PEP-CTERM-associated repeat protein
MKDSYSLAASSSTSFKAEERIGIMGSALLSGPTAQNFSATIDGQGSNLQFGLGLDAALGVTGGAKATGTGLVQKNASGACSGPGSSLILSNQFEIGAAGSARFDITAGGHVECGRATLASGDSGNATLTLTGQSSEWLVQEIKVTDLKPAGR